MNSKVELKSAPFYHRAMIMPSTINEKQREVEVCFASDADVPMWDWEEGRILESLSLDDGAMKLERMNSGAPLLDSHDTYEGLKSVLGKVVEGSVRVQDGKAYCRLRFSSRKSVTDIWHDVKEGIIRNVSVGYNVLKSLYTGDVEGTKRYVATLWEPFEVSLISVPADYRATIRGKAKVVEMIVEEEAEITQDDNAKRDQHILKIKNIIYK